MKIKTHAKARGVTKSSCETRTRPAESPSKWVAFTDHEHDWQEENGRTICKVQGCLPKLGRPFRDGGTVARVTIRLSAIERDLLDSYAAHHRLTQTNALRRMIVRAGQRVPR